VVQVARLVLGPGAGLGAGAAALPLCAASQSITAARSFASGIPIGIVVPGTSRFGSRRNTSSSSFVQLLPALPAFASASL